MDKVVIFIVEGRTDKKALENIFKKIYRHKDIHFEFTQGDITSDNAITKDNVVDEIYKYADSYKKINKLKTSDIWQIVQIFDMDGAYIDDKNIIEGDSKEFVYSLKNISCKDIEKVKQRNEHKRELMDYLLEHDKIRGILYRCYFVSSNLDHALYNEQNLSNDEKISNAQAFYEAFVDKEKLFINFLELDVANGTPDSYPASWRFIRKDSNSLQRHTNLHIYFKENPIL